MTPEETIKLSQQASSLFSGDDVIVVEADSLSWVDSAEFGKWLLVEDYYTRTAVNRALFRGDVHDAAYVTFDRNSSNVLAVKLEVFNQPKVMDSLYLELCQRDDDDNIDKLVEWMVPLLGLEVKQWPTDPTESITRVHYLLLLKRAVDNEDVMFDVGSSSMCVLSDASYETTMSGRPYIDVIRRLSLPYAGGLVAANAGSDSWDNNYTLETMPYVIATAEQCAKAVERGTNMMKSFGASGVSHVMYRGVAYTPGFFGSRVRHQLNTRVVVDTAGYQQINPTAAGRLMNLYGITIVRDNKDGVLPIAEPTEVQLSIVAPVVILYDLSRGMWLIGEVEKTAPIQYRSDAFDRLVLDAPRKRLVRALTTHRANGDIDLIDGKGGGSIFLLDGAPGTGKTLTAEATAEVQQRILYKVSMGELGTSAPDLEKALNQILSLAARWDAVLLMDEADVFLEKRSSENIQRNALVAVFLRLLEYYTGILFLTTNRGDNFDEAFKSRVTLSMHFKRPDIIGMRQIWMGLLGNANISLTKDELDILLDYDINGREIKNAINSSRALAAEDNDNVKLHHIVEILECQKLFATELMSSKR